MTESVYKVENIPLIDFFGIENANIRELSAAFPKTKIISRGDEVKIQGTVGEVSSITEIIDSLLESYNEFGRLTNDMVKEAIQLKNPNDLASLDDEIIIHGAFGQPIKPKTLNQRKIVQAIRKQDLVFALGPAGTGKTYVSVAMAVRALKNKEVKKIIITRPAVEAGENLGFLPGDLKEKINPYLRPIFDAFEDMIPSEKLKMYQETNVIEMAPIAYMRGRTLNHAFILLDEAQNTTPMQMKMFLTRMGINSKVIITGDLSQIDLPRNQKSGLQDAVDHLSKIDEISMIQLDTRDVSRHRLVKKIIDAYDEKDKK